MPVGQDNNKDGAGDGIFIVPRADFLVKKKEKGVEIPMYQPYRGQRNQHQKLLRNIVIITLCMFIAACAIFLLFFQDAFQEWKEEYAQNHPQQTEPSAVAVPDSQETTQTDKNPAESVPQEVAATPTKTLELPVDKLGDATYLQQVIALQEQGSINAASVLLKDEEGNLWYPSEIAEIQKTAVMSTSKTEVLSALQILKAAGLHMTAVLYAYQDNLYPRQNPAALLKNTSNSAWIYNTKRCMDPASDASVQYLTKLVQECERLGFDEVILNSFGWPTQGNVQRIAYGTNADLTVRSQTLVQQLQALKAAAPTIEISVCLEEPLAENGQSVSGQNVSMLYPEAAAIYLPMQTQTIANGDSLRTLLGVQIGGETEKFVPIFTSASVAPTIFSGNQSIYFDTTETKGVLDDYLTTP